jgi:hypothetical protein
MIDFLKPDFWTAVGTIAMAVATFVVVLQGRRHRKDDVRRHEESHKPICLLTPYDGVDPQHWRDTLLAIADSQPNPGFGVVELKGALRNIGSGPALNVAIRFRFVDMDGYATQAWELSPLRPGESRGSKEEPLRIPIQFGPHFNQADFSQIVGKLWEIIVVYRDIFGNQFYAVHEKRPLQLDKLYQTAGHSDFTAPSQRWVTFGTGRLLIPGER